MQLNQLKISLICEIDEMWSFVRGKKLQRWLWYAWEPRLKRIIAHAGLVNNALLMAIWQRKPQKGLIWHTDRGSQYCADSHLNIIKQHGIKQSMSRKGNCWDNAVAESFFHTIKTELVYQHKFKTREEAKHAIFEYIEVITTV